MSFKINYMHVFSAGCAHLGNYTKADGSHLFGEKWVGRLRGPGRASDKDTPGCGLDEALQGEWSLFRQLDTEQKGKGDGKAEENAIIHQILS